MENFSSYNHDTSERQLLSSSLIVSSGIYFNMSKCCTYYLLISETFIGFWLSPLWHPRSFPSALLSPSYKSYSTIFAVPLFSSSQLVPSQFCVNLIVYTLLWLLLISDSNIVLGLHFFPYTSFIFPQLEITFLIPLTFYAPIIIFFFKCFHVSVRCHICYSIETWKASINF